MELLKNTININDCPFELAYFIILQVIGQAIEEHNISNFRYDVFCGKTRGYLDNILILESDSVMTFYVLETIMGVYK